MFNDEQITFSDQLLLILSYHNDEEYIQEEDIELARSQRISSYLEIVTRLSRNPNCIFRRSTYSDSDC
jgi:hypothetical protein